MKTKIKQDDILSAIIHDLKNPTIAQIKALELFLKSTSSKISPEEKDLIELTLNSCSYMQKIIENFSFITQISNEGLRLEYKKFDFIELINSLIAEVEILTKYSGIKIKIKNKEALFINSDKIKIKSAAENLILYCINTAYKNSYINIYANLNNNNLVFEIAFSCPCTKAQDINTMFENVISKPSSNSFCRNIGLYLSKEIINAHFGKMIIKNKNENEIIIGFSLPTK